MEENKAKNNPVGGSQTLNMNLNFLIATADCYPWKALCKKPTHFIIFSLPPFCNMFELLAQQ